MQAKSVKKTLKLALLGAAGLIAVISIANLAWTMSGSSEWKLETDKDGVQVYSYKAPGSHLKMFKGVKRAQYSLSHIVAGILLDNPSLQNCKDWIPTCKSLTVLEPYITAAQGDSVLWTLELLPPLFADREYALKSYVTQDKQTGVVAINMLAAANKVPLHDCCLRITHMHNRWEITPLGHGEVEIQLIQDHSVGGFFPDLLLNLAGADTTWKLFHDLLPVLLNKEKYRTAKFDYIEDDPKVWRATGVEQARQATVSMSKAIQAFQNPL
jgi:hypothetical protein